MSTLNRMNELNNEAMRASNEGRKDDALFKLVQASRMAKALVLPVQEAVIRNNMGIVHQAAGDLNEARSCFRLAGRLAREYVPGDHPILKAIDGNLEKLEAAIRDQAA